MNVWIDQDLCTGDGLCCQLAPSVFIMQDDGLAYVQDKDGVKDSPGGSHQTVFVDLEHEGEVIEAIEECPGECIFIS